MVAEPLLPAPRSMSLGRATVAGERVDERIDRSLPPQGYRLRIASGGVTVDAADPPGAFYARLTLAQLRSINRGRLPVGWVEDWPDFAVRGVMLDVSRDKVPSMATLEATVRRLAALKINHLQLYMEHTFAYRGHEEVWSDASPFDAHEVRRLEQLCSTLHVELSANQNCLGHMERWLRFERYRPLAVQPEGHLVRGRMRPPTTLDPAKAGSLDLVRDLLAQLVPAFRSRRVHVGLDEPWELPPERSGEYLAYLGALRAAPELAGREMLVWGDVLAGEERVLAELPDGVTVCEWGYEAEHSFDERARALAAAGVPFWVCPGTSSWNSVVGRASNMARNCAQAARSGLEHGASGFLVTDWGDNGHLQHQPVADPGLAYAAAVSWCLRTNERLDLGSALSAHVLDDPSGELAAALLALGDAYLLVAPRLANRSVLAAPLLSPYARLGQGRTAELTETDLQRVRELAARSAEAARRAGSRREDAALLREEVLAGIALLDVLVRDATARVRAGGELGAVPASVRTVLARELDDAAARHAAIWLLRNRPGGLADSVARIHALRDAHAVPRRSDAHAAPR